MVEYWPLLPGIEGVTCPVQSTSAGLEEFAKKEELWFQVNTVVNMWRDQIGDVCEDGWISNE
jgi:hypothetical protein